MKRLTAILILALLLTPVCARAEEPEYQDDIIFKIYDEAGAYLTSHAGRVYQDDEYIAEDNKLYIISAVDDSMLTATASYVGMETASERVETQSVFGPRGDERAQRLARDDRVDQCVAQRGGRRQEAGGDVLHPYRRIL
jgi:hypothetical protein